jgi:hypothetical protein
MFYFFQNQKALYWVQVFAIIKVNNQQKNFAKSRADFKGAETFFYAKTRNSLFLIFQHQKSTYMYLLQ